MKRRLLIWLAFYIESALSVRAIERSLKGLGLSRSDAKFVIKHYRAAVRNLI